MNEFAKMTQAERQLLFAAKLLALEEPLQYWRHYLLKYGGPKDMTPQLAAENSNQRNLFDEMKGKRLTLDDLRALLRATSTARSCSFPPTSSMTPPPRSSPANSCWDC